MLFYHSVAQLQLARHDSQTLYIFIESALTTRIGSLDFVEKICSTQMNWDVTEQSFLFRPRSSKHVDVRSYQCQIANCLFKK